MPLIARSPASSVGKMAATNHKVLSSKTTNAGLARCFFGSPHTQAFPRLVKAGMDEGGRSAFGRHRCAEWDPRCGGPSANQRPNTVARDLEDLMVVALVDESGAN